VGEVANVAYGREVTIARIAELVCAAAGTELAPVYAEARPADVERHYADVSRIHAATPWRAEVPIEQGIERYVAWFIENNHDHARLLESETERNWEQAVGG
jgi:nucleoside-diphosphate-sugar epimerase